MILTLTLQPQSLQITREQYD